jgi:hypothetical protein
VVLGGWLWLCALLLFRTEEKYVIHKIPHEGTTVIQVLRTNKRIYEDDENDAEAEAETAGVNVDMGEEGEKKSEEAKSEENDGEETRAHQAKKSEEEEKEKSEEIPAVSEAVAKTQNTKRRKSGKQGKSAGNKKNKAKKDNTPMETDSPSDTPAASAGNADADEKAKQPKKAGQGKKKGRRGAKRGGPTADGDEELVDWGWDFVTGDDEGQVILWSGHEFKEKKTVSAHDFIWWLEVHGDTCITASTDCTAKGIFLFYLFHYFYNNYIINVFICNLFVLMFHFFVTCSHGPPCVRCSDRLEQDGGGPHPQGPSDGAVVRGLLDRGGLRRERRPARQFHRVAAERRREYDTHTTHDTRANPLHPI